MAASKNIDPHYFTIKDQIYKQRDGCEIGLNLTVELASIYMLLWVEKFLEKCKTLGIKVDLYKRYVDDTVIVLPSINGGWYFNSKKGCMRYNTSN